MGHEQAHNLQKLAMNQTEETIIDILNVNRCIPFGNNIKMHIRWPTKSNRPKILWLAQSRFGKLVQVPH
jgi:hypothetical protein